ncbi:chorismate mutase [Luteibaculum oceani]|nr:chorismate mutase [Luteibaculum oceani]
MNITPLNAWISSEKKPFLIAGPCSAESEAQMETIASQLSEIKAVGILRAGIWKPRTRPGDFEGVGEKGLPWLVNAAKKYGYKSAAEVANASHVEKALSAGVDILWVGARTTVNPFSVQEIADALKGKDIPVLVKNPVNPDIGLWMGAIERLNRAGITKLAAVHRGFSPVEKTPFRNEPMWEIAIDLKRKLPELPIICDPSHIGGDRALIESVSQKALDLDMQGLMIETHPDPDKAWTDAKQQVSPKQLKSILDNLVIRVPQSDDPTFKTVLEELRQEIDLMDEKLLRVLAERMKLVEKIGDYKKDNDITILQVARWNEIVETRTAYAKNLQLNKDFTQKLLEIIHSESIRKQNAIMNDFNEPSKA